MELGACERVEHDELTRLTTCSEDEEPDFYLFLSKFKYLDKMNWTEQLVADKIRFVCNTINKENCDGVFIDFSVSKYRHIGWSLKESISFILDRFADYSLKPIVPILSIKYESPFDVQCKISNIVNSDISDRICGIDFVGDEDKFNHKNQKYICDMWSGKFIRLHVGELKSQDNIRATIENINITNIAHGIKIVDKDLISISIDNGISFDIAPTSNYMTGVIKKHVVHPAKFMIDNGINITIGSDDPNVLNTNLDNEYKLLKSHGVTDDELSIIRSNSIEMLKRWSNYIIKNIS